MLRGKVQGLRASLQNRFMALTKETDSIDAMNNNLTNIIKECAMEVEGGVQSLGRILASCHRR